MNKRNEKGITLVVLIITVILMIILAGVTIATGISAYRQSEVTEFVAQMQIIQRKVDMVVSDKNVNIASVYGTDNITSRGDYTSRIKPIMDTVRASGGITGSDSDFIYFNTDNMKDKFDINNLQEGEDFVINFITREVVSLEGVVYHGKTYYTQYNEELPNGQKLLSYNNIQDLSCTVEVKNLGLNAKITIKNLKLSNLTIRYKQESTEDEWHIIENHAQKGKEYEIVVTKLGVYRIRVSANDESSQKFETTVNVAINNAPKLTDTLTPTKYDNTEINKNDTAAMNMWYNYSMVSPMTSNNWAYCKSGTKYYMWIPRIAYKGTQYKFLKGNSKTTTDGTTIDDTWVVPDKFETLTGIWVEVTEAVSSRSSFNIINIFTNGTFLTGRDIIKVI